MGNPHSKSRRDGLKISSPLEKINDTIQKNDDILIILQDETDKVIKSNDSTIMAELGEQITAHNLQLRLLNTEYLDKAQVAKLEKIIYEYETLLAKLNSARLFKKISEAPDESRGGVFDDLQTVCYKMKKQPNIIEDIADNHEIDMSKYPILNDILRLFDSTEELEEVREEVAAIIEANNDGKDGNKFSSAAKILQLIYNHAKCLFSSSEEHSSQESEIILKELLSTLNKLQQCAIEYSYLQRYEENVDSLIKLYKQGTQEEFVKKQMILIQGNIQKGNYEFLISKHNMLLKNIEHFFKETTTTQLAIAYDSATEIRDKNESSHPPLPIPKSTTALPTGSSPPKLPERTYVNNIELLEDEKEIINAEVNNDDVSSVDSKQKDNVKSRPVRTKSRLSFKVPMQSPRNTNNIVVNRLPIHWKKLNELLEKTECTDEDKKEIAKMRENYELAKSLFEKIFGNLKD